jgi:hypothetical protein
MYNMSTAGIYNYHPKVVHPNKVFGQMDSDWVQPSWYFGGSQIPVNLGIGGSGFKTHYKSSIKRDKLKLGRLNGMTTSVDKHSKIMLPYKGSGMSRINVYSKI